MFDNETLRFIIESRFVIIPDLGDISKKLGYYGVNLYDNQGKFNYYGFRESCIKTSNLLKEFDEPVDGIKYQLCDFYSAITKITGNRNFNQFINGLDSGLYNQKSI